MDQEIKDLILDEEYETALKKLLTYPKEYLAKIQCLYELNKYGELVTFFNDIEDKIEEDYYEILGYYILSLIELEHFDKALDALNEELSLPYIQDNYLVALNDLYDTVIADKQAYLLENNLLNNNYSIEQLKEIFTTKQSYDNLLSAIQSLEDINIRKILKEIEVFLEGDNSPILKSFILEILIKQQVSDEVLVIKDDVSYEFSPLANQYVLSNHNYLVCANLLEEHLDKQPSFLEMSLNVLDSLVYLIYPLVIEDDKVNEIAALIEYYVFTMNYEELNNDFESFYNQSVNDIISNVDWLIHLLQTEERFYDN